MVRVTLLGSSGTLPLDKRPLTSLFVNYEGSAVLFDCGEGTQTSLRGLRLKTNDVDVICLTHKHSDHVLGIPGLITTINQQCVDTDTSHSIVLIAPIDARETINCLLGSIVANKVRIGFIWLTENKETIDFENYSIEAQLLEHSTPCYGFRYVCKNTGHLNQEVAEKSRLSAAVLGAVRKGHFVMTDSDQWDQKRLYQDYSDDVVITYATDTIDCSGLDALAKNADLAVIEGMYAADEDRSKYEDAKHLIAPEAADVALRNGVRRLWLTHFSPSLSKTGELAEVAQAIFENSRAGYKGLSGEADFNHEFVEKEREYFKPANSNREFAEKKKEYSKSAGVGSGRDFRRQHNRRTPKGTQ